MKTFLERLQDATTYDGQLEKEIYLELYREDLLRKAGKKADLTVVEVQVLKTSGKAKTWAAALSEHEHRDAYATYDLREGVWVHWSDDSTSQVHIPMFTYSFDNAIQLIPKDVGWACGADPTDEETPFWAALDHGEQVRHKTLPLAIALLAVREKYRDPSLTLATPEAHHADPF